VPAKKSAHKRPSPPHAGEFEHLLDPRPSLLRRLQILQICAPSGSSFSPREIARFTGASRQAVEKIEKVALIKLARALLERHPQLFSEFRPA
jgi:hypothetical protein